jgi:hypothetical protein
MNDREGLPTGFPVPQPLKDTFASVRGRGMRVDPGRLIDHQKVIVFETN